LLAALRAMSAGDIEFIVVGGLSAVLNGAPVHTYDIDVVYSREPANVSRLLVFLRSVNAVFRIQPERRLPPAESHLAGGGHLNLLTDHGPLDLLGAIGRNVAYSELLPHSVEMELGEGRRVRVLQLEKLIEFKEQLGSEKDLAVLPILRRTLAEIRKRR
ncbi:MAG: hypothetical protein NTY38_20930, partial [Acidobacteria bacterium]|nr:hypothetical protein [Acidobacteriota bacterium]